MRAALETPQAPVFAGEDERHCGFKPAPWSPPAVIPPEMQREAVHVLGSLKARSAPVSQAMAEQWVAHLANLCAGKELPPETKLAGAVSAILLEGYPAALFDDPADLLRVARQFQWWPGWAELAKVLDAERDDLRHRWERVAVIARGGAPRTAKPGQDDQESPPATEEQKAAVKALLDKAFNRMPGSGEE